MLHDIQQQFINAVYRNDEALLSKIDASIRPATTQIDIYRHSIFGGLLKALSEIYPVTKRLLGDEFFDAMCMRYIRQTPSISPDINNYGESLSKFVAGFAPLAELVYLPDVLRLEWAWHMAYQAQQIQVNDLHSLINMPLERLTRVRLIIHPTGSLIESEYPIQRIWLANQAENINDQEHISLEQGGCQLFVWRKQNDMHIDNLCADDYAFLTAVSEDKSIDQLIQSEIPVKPSLIRCLSAGYIHNYSVT